MHRTARVLLALVATVILTLPRPVLQLDGVAAEPQPPRATTSEITPEAPPDGKWVLQGRSETPFKVGNCEKPGSSCTSTERSITMGYPSGAGSDDSCTGNHGWSAPPAEMIPGQTITFHLSVGCEDRYRQECATGLTYSHYVGDEFIDGETIATAAVYPSGYEGKGTPRPSVTPTWKVIPGEENGRLDIMVWCMSCDAKDVHYGYAYQTGSAAARPTPTPAPTPTPTPSSTPAPQLPPIRGKVSVSDPSGAVPNLPLLEVMVSLVRKGEVLSHTVSQAPDGAFSLGGPPADKADDLSIRVALTHGTTNPHAFDVRYADQWDPVVAETEPFSLPAGSSSPYVRDVDVGATSGITSDPTYRAKLMDLALVYYHTRQAWETAAIDLGITMEPVAVRAFSEVETSFLLDTIYIHKDISSWTDPNRPGNREWHEYGHNAMFSLLHDDPGIGQGTQHDGYLNCFTNNSYSEGFAEFFAMLTAKHRASGGSARSTSTSPWLYHWYGTADNLEANYKSWSYVPSGGGIRSLEEFAVAGLLWDLVDEANTLDVTEYAGFPAAYQGLISLPNGSTAATAVAGYHDHIAISEKRLLEVMRLKPPDGPHIYQISQLYAMLKSEKIGQERPHPDSDLTALDEAFIAHGFFADTSPQNLSYDKGEKIGFTDHDELIIQGVTVKYCVPREVPLPIADSFIGYQVRDATTGASADVRQFDVEVRFEPPFDYYTYAFQAQAVEPGRLYFVGPDPQYRATVTVAPGEAGFDPGEPLVFTNESYWHEMRKAPAGNFTEFTFKVKATDQGAGPPSSGSAARGTEGGTLPPYVPVLVVVSVGAMALLLLLRRLRWSTRTPLQVASTAGAAGTTAGAGPVTPPVIGPASCSACGAPARPEARYCRGCGRPLAGPSSTANSIQAVIGPASCSACGAPARPEAKYCRGCGRPL